MVANVESLSERYNGYISPLEAEEVRKSRDMELQEMQESQVILDEIRVILEASRRETQKLSDDQKQRAHLQDLACDYEGYKDFNPRRVPGTCEWFLKDDRFLEWRSSDFGLLWVSAGPGCGKSVLSRALIDKRRLATNVATSMICYFFFKDGDGGRMYAPNALCAILHQLFTSTPTSGLIQYGLSSHKNYGKNLAGNFSELWQILMNCVKSPDAGEIVCVLDALDECHHDSREQLINKLREFYQQHAQASGPRPKVKFLIASRPYDDLAAAFSRFSHTLAYVPFDGDDKSAQISKGINLVIDARVDEIAVIFERPIVEGLPNG
ncbi:hypothetical protein VTN49DRAFT_3891 [Thermomyces lanuginosus]|uniref:uncharacterized protein n=1 Tax=Thermomyces lanuginosus TaxID=5541 RepID=UPI003744AB7A